MSGTRIQKEFRGGTPEGDLLREMSRDKYSTGILYEEAAVPLIFTRLIYFYVFISYILLIKTVSLLGFPYSGAPVIGQTSSVWLA